MADNSQSLTDQLAARAKAFCANTGFSQRRLARLLKIEEFHFSRFLNGQANLSAETTLRVLQLINLSKRDVALKFGSPERTTSRLMHLQEGGRDVGHFGDWVAKEDGNGYPVDSTDITSTPTKRDKQDAATDYESQTSDFLKGQQKIHRSAIKAIDNYIWPIFSKPR
jgi:transcriptional regulator with XRE-family HTH domain